MTAKGQNPGWVGGSCDGGVDQCPNLVVLRTERLSVRPAGGLGDGGWREHGDVAADTGKSHWTSTLRQSPRAPQTSDCRRPLCPGDGRTSATRLRVHDDGRRATRVWIVPQTRRASTCAAWCDC